MAKDILLSKSPCFTEALKSDFPEKESKSILVKNGQLFLDWLYFASELVSHKFVLALGELWE